MIYHTPRTAQLPEVSLTLEVPSSKSKSPWTWQSTTRFQPRKESLLLRDFKTSSPPNQQLPTKHSHDVRVLQNAKCPNESLSKLSRISMYSNGQRGEGKSQIPTTSRCKANRKAH